MAVVSLFVSRSLPNNVPICQNTYYNIFVISVLPLQKFHLKCYYNQLSYLITEHGTFLTIPECSNDLVLHLQYTNLEIPKPSCIWGRYSCRKLLPKYRSYNQSTSMTLWNMCTTLSLSPPFGFVMRCLNLDINLLHSVLYWYFNSNTYYSLG